MAWRALAALRLRESSSMRISTRRRLEYEGQQAHAPALSELLLLRWRAGDWNVSGGDKHITGYEICRDAGFGPLRYRHSALDSNGHD